MKDDYLWDRGGKPNPETQQLEKILGELRYQPRPLEIPALTHRSRFFFRGLAVAAAIAVIVLGLGLWLAMQKRQSSELTKTDSKPGEIENSSLAAASTVDEKKLSGLLASVDAVEERFDKRSGSRPSRSRRIPARATTLNPNELAEAEAAKDQLMLALRLTSSKLNLAQKRIQGAGSDNSVHNQHKIG
jgi:hypothetical protein